MGDYTEAWNEYRRYRRDLLLVWVGYIPVVGAIAAISGRLFHTFIPAMIAVAAWMLLFIFAGVRYQTFRCPRCGEWFAGDWWYSLSFLARKCVHCGLPKFSEDRNYPPRTPQS